LAGCASTIATYPLDLLRTRFAAQGTEKIYKSISDSIHKIAKNEGICGFYRGAVPAMLQVLPYTGLIFSSHTMVKQRLLWIGNERIVDIIAGGVAGAVSKAIVMPFDVVRYVVVVS
jgi:solute carrier family 25 thiamine pyrophosphate transporter 19